MRTIGLGAICVVGLAVVAWLFFGGGRWALFYLQATASKIRRAVFSVLLIWALADSVLTFRDWKELPPFFRLCGFVGSFLLSFLFIGLLALAWDWIAHRWGRRAATWN
jgi:hypothetical protein